MFKGPSPTSFYSFIVVKIEGNLISRTFVPLIIQSIFSLFNRTMISYAINASILTFLVVKKMEPILFQELLFDHQKRKWNLLVEIRSWRDRNLKFGPNCDLEVD